MYNYSSTKMLDTRRWACKLVPTTTQGDTVNGYARLARTLMNQHGLTGWKIEWSRSKKTHGLCRYATKTLVFSQAAFSIIGEDEVRNTILHEIAHALAGGLAGHGPTWQRIHREIGGTGAQYVSKNAAATIAATAPWQGKCPKCSKVTPQHRAPLRVKSCACGVRFKPEHVLVWHKEGRKVNPYTISTRYATEYRRMVATYGDRLPI